MFSELTRVYQSDHTAPTLSDLSQPLLSSWRHISLLLSLPKCISCLYQSYQAYHPSSFHLSSLLLSGDIHFNPGPAPAPALAPTLLTSYFALSTLVPRSLPHTLLLSVTLQTTYNLTFLLSLKPGSDIHSSLDTKTNNLSRNKTLSLDNFSHSKP